MVWTPPAEDIFRRSEQWHVRIRGLHKTFGQHQVLRGVDLDIARGKINVIIGGSGQGKSVIIKHIIGLLKPDRGHIVVDGEDIVPMSEYQLNRVRRKFGMLFQYAALFDSLTVEENILFPLIEHGLRGPGHNDGVRRRMSRAEMRQVALEQMDKLRLPHVLLRKFPSELSGGQRKRVGLARALVLRPEILLYDEPTTGLDPVATKNVDDMIRDISQREGVTSVVISHDMASTFRIGDRVSMLYEGRIVESGTPDEIRRSRHRYLRLFVETSGTVQLDPVPDSELVDGDGPGEAPR
ncbi:MAG: ABC transporter ATP-binding protein [Myxococcales bacterium]|nr:ABC transporter ATP-binding protein [Myxococcota bacterium]MDW8283946.1 ABC transporter ATP-binding protein [Myxococcales bacterium]